MKLFLASQSPRRREILRQLAIDFDGLATAVDETPLPNELPANTVKRLALAKAVVGLDSLAGKADDPCVLGADTIVCIDGKLLGKPQNRAHAVEMLLSLANRTHQVISAVALCSNSVQVVDSSITEVDFTAITPALADRYWRSGEPQDKAGAYAIQGLGAVFVRQIRGSYSGVVGLPIEILIPMLRRFSIPYWSLSE